MAGAAEGKVAFVTGAGSGIGESTALAFAREGAKVVLADVNADNANRVLKMIEGKGGKGIVVKTDTSKSGDVEAAVKKAVDTYGKLDCAVNNAGIQGEIVKTAECTEANWDRITSVNLKGVFLCMKYQIQAMLKNGAGAIVNIGSNFALVGCPGMPAYSAAKHGLIGLTKTAALEYGLNKIRVNAVCPGPTLTPMVDSALKMQPELQKVIDTIIASQPIGRMGKPEEVAEAILWMCSDAASVVTGAVLSADGGFVAR